MDNAAREIQFFGHQGVRAEGCVVNAGASGFIPIEARETGDCRIEIHARRRAEVNEAIVAKTAEALLEGKIDWPHLAVRPKTEVVCLGLQIGQEHKFVSANVVAAVSRATVTLGRITHAEPD